MGASLRGGEGAGSLGIGSWLIYSFRCSVCSVSIMNDSIKVIIVHHQSSSTPSLFSSSVLFMMYRFQCVGCSLSTRTAPLRDFINDLTYNNYYLLLVLLPWGESEGGEGAGLLGSRGWRICNFHCSGCSVNTKMTSCRNLINDLIENHYLLLVLL